MRKFLRYLFALTTLAVAGCHGDVNDLDTPTPPAGDGDGDGSSTTSGLVLSIDKQTIEADGRDAVTFSLTLDGEELMNDDKTLGNVRIKHEVGDIKLERYAKSFSAVRNGNYSFVATYKGQQSKNSVHVKARNRENYEPYGQKIIVYKMTGTWCGYCPQMTAALKNVSSMWKNNMIVAALHNGDQFSVPSSGGGDLAGAMLSRFGGTGLPSCVYDLSFLDDKRTPAEIEANLEEILREQPATCGVKISQAIMLNGTLNISAGIISPKGGEYDMGYIILLDNQYYTGGTATDNMYNDIACAVSDNLMSMSDARFTLAAGEEATKRFSVKGLPTDNVDDMRVVVFALSKQGGKTVVDNANICAIGSSADYMAVEFIDGLPEGVTPDDEEKPAVPEGVLHLSADKTTLTADGTDEVVFTVKYGSEDVSNGRTMNLIYTLAGEQTDLAAGANRFSTTTPGTYIFKARYYKGGDIYSENEITLTATAPIHNGTQAFRHKMLGMQFTSVGCPNCPVLSTVIAQIQQEQPARLVPVSFHLDYNISDPMKVSIADNYYNALEPNGLPRFYLDLRIGEQMTSNKSVIDAEMTKTLANYPPSCGVAITTTYDKATRKLTITPRIQSNTSTAYRYLVFLVEDGIEYSQYGTTGRYTHNNVVRAVLSDNIYGTRFNGGVALTAGKDTPLSSPLTTTLASDWRAENMRVVCSALTTQNGGVTYACNNTNECRVGESVGYALEGDEGEGNGGGDSGDNGGGDVKKFNRHVAVFEFTGAWCSYCPSGYRFLQTIIELYYSTETVHILAFHDSTGGNDPMGIPLTNTMYNHFSLGGYPAFVVDMRDASTEKSDLETMLSRSFKEHPANCGIRLSSTCSGGKGKVTAEVAASASDTYRIALYLLEDGIVAKQVDNGLEKVEYVHNHVVRTMLSSLYEGDRIGALAAGESKSMQYDFTIDGEWKQEKCSICAVAIDGNGYVNNVALCPVNGTTEFDYQK
jgi:thiol-disulfide isomerase/thioredoxin